MAGSLHRHKATWRSLIFNRRYLDTGAANPDDPANLSATYVDNDYYLDQLDTSRVSVQDYRELRQFLEGAEPNEAYEGVRALNAIGRIIAPDYGTLEDMAMALDEGFSVAACRRAALAADPVGLLPFSGKIDTAPVTGADKIPATKAVRFYCRPGPGRPVQIGRVRGGLVRPFSWQLIAFDPFMYDEAETTKALTLGSATTVTNPGNMYARPKITIALSAAGAANFTLTNSTTGKVLVLDLSGLGVGVYYIDVAADTFKGSAGANRYASRVSGFITDQWLEPGNNSVTASNTTNVTSVTYTFRGPYA